MDSIWSKTANAPRFDSLKGDIKTDVLIVGGGMAGILCAYMMDAAGIDCTVIEAERICKKNTKNTTAKITLQHGLIYDDMISKFGEDFAQKYVGAQCAAMEKYRDLCRDTDCDYQTRDACVFSRKDRAKIEREAAAYERLGIKAEVKYDLGLPFSAVGVYVTEQAQFHPLKFAFSIAKNLKIYEDTKALEFLPDGVITNRGKIFAEKVVIATHFPIINKHGGYFLKMYQHRSYVLALKNAPQPDAMYVDEDMTGLSFREHNGILLLGGGGHRTGKNGGGWRELEEFAKRNYPESETVARFAAQDCMTLDSIPYIGRYSRRTPNLFVATGFNKWGMTSSMAAAMVLTDAVLGRQNPFADVFSPSRSILHRQLLLNITESTVGLLTPTAPRCPHLGCALKYNRQEHSWDCPCHGSRFSSSGEVIDNPATDDKK